LTEIRKGVHRHAKITIRRLRMSNKFRFQNCVVYYTNRICAWTRVFFFGLIRINFFSYTNRTQCDFLIKNTYSHKRVCFPFLFIFFISSGFLFPKRRSWSGREKKISFQIMSPRTESIVIRIPVFKKKKVFELKITLFEPKTLRSKFVKTGTSHFLPGYR